MDLEDLPEHRREPLMRRFAIDLRLATGEEPTKDDVLALMRERAAWGCAVGRGDVPPVREAVLGDDGRYHLRVDGRQYCVRAGRHRQHCLWWTDGDRYRIQAPSGHPRGEYGSSVLTWTVTFTDVVTDPALVSRSERCPVNAMVGEWPAYLGGKQRKTRQLLVGLFGPNCQTCHRRPGEFIDHDHATGLVRGLLCRYCNTWIDKCLHPSGCPWGDYLNAPPATYLRIRYSK